jgi:predicted small lipoprotein YifL
MNRTLKIMNLVVVVVCVGLGLAACGKKMQLTPPDGATYPHQYPKPQ